MRSRKEPEHPFAELVLRPVSFFTSATSHAVLAAGDFEQAVIEGKEWGEYCCPEPIPFDQNPVPDVSQFLEGYLPEHLREAARELIEELLPQWEIEYGPEVRKFQGTVFSDPLWREVHRIFEEDLSGVEDVSLEIVYNFFKQWPSEDRQSFSDSYYVYLRELFRNDELRTALQGAPKEEWDRILASEFGISTETVQKYCGLSEYCMEYWPDNCIEDIIPAAQYLEAKGLSDIIPDFRLPEFHTEQGLRICREFVAYAWKAQDDDEGPVFPLFEKWLEFISFGKLEIALQYDYDEIRKDYDSFSNILKTELIAPYARKSFYDAWKRPLSPADWNDLSDGFSRWNKAHLAPNEARMRLFTAEGYPSIEKGTLLRLTRRSSAEEFERNYQALRPFLGDSVIACPTFDEFVIKSHVAEIIGMIIAEPSDGF